MWHCVHMQSYWSLIPGQTMVFQWTHSLARDTLVREQTNNRPHYGFKVKVKATRSLTCMISQTARYFKSLLMQLKAIYKKIPIIISFKGGKLGIKLEFIKLVSQILVIYCLLMFGKIMNQQHLTLSNRQHKLETSPFYHWSIIYFHFVAS